MEYDQLSRVCGAMSAVGTCWQHDIRIQNRNSDLNREGLVEADVSDLVVTNFVLAYEDKRIVWNEVKEFIERHEWLGSMSLYPTHVFTARYNGILAGVVVLDMPGAFSKMLGENTRKLERLISRGACVSWSPKNLASALIMFGVRWAVKNTPYRLFVAYSDSEAGEIGTIYQACNFYYLGAKFGTLKQYQIPNGRWVSDRYFRCRSVYKRLAKEIGIDWDASWQKRDSVLFSNMPVEHTNAIKAASKKFMYSCLVREIPPKGKYAYILGSNKRETRALRKIFETRCKVYPYPKRETV